PMVVNTGSKLVLIDTGYGPIAPTVGLLPQSLAAAGIDPKSIDIVLISHLHGDHINGIKKPDGSLAFPNAEIKVPAEDWAFWMSEENMAKAPEGFFKASFGFNRKVFGDIKTRVTVYQWGSEVAPGITAVETAGHTPGHTSFVIASGASKLFFQGDVTNVPALFLRNPDWQVRFDGEPEKAAATRKRVYDKVKNTYSPIVLTTGGQRVLFDTGNGSAAAAESNNERGTLNAHLAAAGIDRSAIDVVVISHFHADHVNGLLMPDNSKAFPNAE